MDKTTLLRLPQVEQSCGLKKSTIYAQIKEGTFPRPVKLGARSVAWRSNEVDEWIQARPRTQ
ncbi:MAG: AlpA family transcriptional regulator [Desulfobacterales bacterium]|nr:AlpA family transcriptional regulator [Desulfobacterales bacterium]